MRSDPNKAIQNKLSFSCDLHFLKHLLRVRLIFFCCIHFLLQFKSECMVASDYLCPAFLFSSKFVRIVFVRPVVIEVARAMFRRTSRLSAPHVYVIVA